MVRLAARAKDEGNEIAQRFGVVEHPRELHTDRRRVEDAHVERE